MCYQIEGMAGGSGGCVGRRRRLLLVLVALALLFTSCRRVERPAVSQAFYYWRTTFGLTAAEQRALSDLAVDKLYLRAFDVVPGHDDAPELVGVVQVTGSHALSKNVEVVPVVFLKNQIFTSAEPEAQRVLARRVSRELTNLGKALGRARSFQELQLDCDWTDSTRERYFAFVRALRELSAPGTRLSATIRLHQIKFRERTGVPPVDRGMLMFYNMGRFSGEGKDRSIFDAEAAQRYLGRLETYPLPLDAALPIWAWTLQLRDGEVVGLLQSTDPAELPELDFVAEQPAQRFEVTRTTFLRGTLLRAGDVLKGETLSAADLRSAARLLAQNLAQPASARRTVALFDLAERNLNRYGLPALQQTFQSLR